jgi:hypothetical protein
MRGLVMRRLVGSLRGSGLRGSGLIRSSAALVPIADHEEQQDHDHDPHDDRYLGPGYEIDAPAPLETAFQLALSIIRTS